VDFSIELIDKLHWFYMFTLIINCSVLYQTKENLMLLKKPCKVNKGKFGKRIINVIDNCKRVL
jgi:hypothetical protein